MSCDSDEVRRFLISVIERSKDYRIEDVDITTTDLSRALYGLNLMTSDSPEIRQILSIFINVLPKLSGKLSGPELAKCLYGLRSMTSDSAEMSKLLTIFANEISTSQEEFSAPVLGTLFYGLSKKSLSDCEGVLPFLQAMHQKLEASTGVFDSQSIGNSLFGLILMEWKYNIVRKILLSLKGKLKQSIDTSEDKIFMDALTRNIVARYANDLRGSNSSSLQEVFAVMQDYLLLSKLKKEDIMKNRRRISEVDLGASEVVQLFPRR
jgi:hypothetical protein